MRILITISNTPGADENGLQWDDRDATTKQHGDIIAHHFTEHSFFIVGKKQCVSYLDAMLEYDEDVELSARIPY